MHKIFLLDGLLIPSSGGNLDFLRVIPDFFKWNEEGVLKLLFNL